MRVNGSHQRQLTHDNATEYDPSVSLDGKKIAFEKDSGSADLEIFTMRANGSHQRQLTHNSKTDEFPHWARLP